MQLCRSSEIVELQETRNPMFQVPAELCRVHIDLIFIHYLIRVLKHFIRKCIKAIASTLQMYPILELEKSKSFPFLIILHSYMEISAFFSL